MNDVDGLPGGEGVFLPCSFWLVDALVHAGARRRGARALRAAARRLRNDLGLLSEEYDPVAKRLLGNFPQAFTHVGLVNSAYNLSHHDEPERSSARPALPEQAAFVDASSTRTSRHRDQCWWQPLRAQVRF